MQKVGAEANTTKVKTKLENKGIEQTNWDPDELVHRSLNQSYRWQFKEESNKSIFIIQC